MQPNRRRILNSILYLIAKGEQLGRPLTQYQIVKSIFLADTAHLNAYGRPVTFDNYSALQFGPVPEEAYDMLKPNYDWAKHFEMAAAPWARQQVGEKIYQFVQPSDFDRRVLSKTDLRALTEGLETVRTLGFGAIVDETHRHPAYVEAWQNRGSANARRMDYALLFESPDREGAESLAYVSAHS